MISALLALTPVVAIRRLVVSAMENNVYLLTSPPTGHQILIDAADDPARITRMIEESTLDTERPRLSAIITTHKHADHIGALAAMANLTAAPVLAGAADAAEIQAQTGVPVARGLQHGDRVGVPGLSLQVIGLRGHTEGSIALAWQELGQPAHLFTGDSLFPGGVGKTDDDQRRFRTLITDVNERVFACFDDAAVVHPGHGAPTTLGAERPHLQAWWDRGW
ncbi:MAG: MBL fold metallo-hydrolase [Bifidobacteriaceae bacterium]|jgi:glyoxylase-like metal-dependent hydrolase (beta-lactamase superfamily II)|nr:MBL fold metallo-hydrolase [Bifidobacteriaceae bacterium]